MRPSMTCRIVAVAVGFLWHAQVTAAEGELATAIANLQNQEVNIQSSSMRFSIEAVQRVGATTTPMLKNSAYRYFTSGSKRRSEEEFSFDGSENTSIIDAYNGEKHFQHTPTYKHGGITSNRTLPVSYPDFVYLFPNGLSEILDEHAAKIQEASQLVDGEELLSLSWTLDAHREMNVLLNPAAAYQPRRITRRITYTEPGAMPSQTKRFALHEARIMNYVQKGEFYFPSEVVTIFDVTFEDGHVERISELKLKLLEVEPNAKIPPEMFEIEFPKGTTVRDLDKEIVYVVGEPFSTRPIRTAEEPAGEAPARWLGLTPFYWAVLGVLMIGGALVMRWRSSVA